MKCLVSKHMYFIWVAQSYFSYQRNCSIVHGGERDTHGLTRTSPTWLDHPVRPFGCVPKQNVQQSTFPGPREKEERGSLRGQVERGDEGERRREREKESAR